jgi:hypothetical protein
MSATSTVGHDAVAIDSSIAVRRFFVMGTD